MKLPCEYGLRSRTYYVLSGSVLSVWNKVESVLISASSNFASRMQIIRMQTDDGDKIVGTLIPQSALSQLCSVLSENAKTNVTMYNQNPEEHNAAANALICPPPLPQTSSLPFRTKAEDHKPGLHASQSLPVLNKGYKSQTDFSSSSSPSYSYKSLPSGSITPLGKRAVGSSLLTSNTVAKQGTNGRQTVVDTKPSLSHMSYTSSSTGSPSFPVTSGIKTEVKTEIKTEIKEEVKEEPMETSGNQEEEEEQYLSMPTFD